MIIFDTPVFFFSSAFLEQEINRSLNPPLKGPLPPPCPVPSAPQPRELITIEEESERLARELREVKTMMARMFCRASVVSSLLTFDGVCRVRFGPQVSRNRDSLKAQLTQLCQYKGVLTKTHSLTATQVSLTLTLSANYYKFFQMTGQQEIKNASFPISTCR